MTSDYRIFKMDSSENQVPMDGSHSTYEGTGTNVHIKINKEPSDGQ